MSNESVENLVKVHTEELYRWAFYKTSSQVVAEDLVQDTFLVAAEKFSTFQGKSTAKTWLFSILNNKIVDYYRKKAKIETNIDNNSLSAFFDSDGSWNKNSMPSSWDTSEEHLLDNHDFKLVLKQCLDALPEKWNLCVKLKYLSGKAGEEICQEVGITSSNFWQIIHRSKLQLRECIENNWFTN